MAQAFKFPTEANGGHRATPPFGAWRRRAALDRRSRHTVEAGSLASNMALPPARRKHAGVQPMRSQQSRFPVRAILIRLINPERFDKNFRPARLERVDQEPGR
ncbi:hypothetical protein P0R31_28450 [Bradyrhizobium yuanmingense]|uniref:hypothetical protein n=1 Tax=Bradyrhizobium yuanmingense TaxID=108015 RepID=UPI0023B9EDFA|nr:hypothetical protein [Bradyrhizobium yuanmingense]MDF0521181.1 hypothetical protein [Bradyrhizobium yuanmingense]